MEEAQRMEVMRELREKDSEKGRALREADRTDFKEDVCRKLVQGGCG